MKKSEIVGFPLSRINYIVNYSNSKQAFKLEYNFICYLVFHCFVKAYSPELLEIPCTEIGVKRSLGFVIVIKIETTLYKSYII